jgi:hypothetical protein
MPDPPAENRQLDVLIGTWRTEGVILGDDGSTEVGRVEGTDAYEWLGGHFVIHRIDVSMGGEPVQGLEVIGPYDTEAGGFPTRAYDNQGGVQTSLATVEEDRVLEFGADGARATLRVSEDSRTAHADWVRSDDGGETWVPWMRLDLTKQPGSA